MRNGLVALAVAAVALGTAASAFAAGEGLPPKDQSWSFDGLFGTYDRATLRRGLTVYRNICSNCHSLNRVAFRNLGDLGFTKDQVKKIAASYQVTDGPNDQGEMYKRKGRPSDYFVPPFPNEQAARAANNGALPPDLSLIVKSLDGGAARVYSILTGFQPKPPDNKNACREMVEEVQPGGGTKQVLHVPIIPDGKFYNPYFPGCVIAMPPPLSEGAVEYQDGTKATVPQMAHDVAAFLTWASEPTLEVRKRMGVRVILFLLVLTGLLYAVKRKVWAEVH